MASKTKLLSAKEKKLQAKKNILNIVEQMLEENIPKEWFLENCAKLCQSDYDDVVQERSIEKLCGYPVCAKPIEKVVKQQYHICKAANKIYDITERKNFCSNECYKASNFLKAQLHSLPLYMRKIGESSLILRLLSDSDNRGSVGEELQFHHTISEREIEKVIVKPLITTNLATMLQEDIKDCVEHLADLKIKENVFKNAYVFGTEEQDKQHDTRNNETESETSTSDVSDNEDKTLFHDFDDVKELSNKHMPIPDNTKKALLIDPLKLTEQATTNPSKLSIDFISNVFYDWFTEDTMKYLLGEKQLYSIKADHLFKTMISSDDKSDNLSTIKDEYINLCLKIDKLPEREVELSDTEIDITGPSPVRKSEISQDNLDKLAAEADSASVTVKKNPKRRTKRKGKSVSFAPTVKPNKDKFAPKVSPDESDLKNLPEPTFPLVDSISQNALRKLVLMGRLKNVYFDLLSLVGLQYRDIREEVSAMVDTFSLTPSNIVFKPKQLKCIAVVLFRILTNTRLKELHEDSQFSKLCESSFTVLNISECEINSLALNLISSDQVLRLQRNVIK